MEFSFSVLVVLNSANFEYKAPYRYLYSDDFEKIGSNDLRLSGVTSWLDVTSSPKKDRYTHPLGEIFTNWDIALYI